MIPAFRRLRARRPRIETTVPARLAIWTTAVYAVWQGSWILLSGPQRWASPSYAVLRQLPFSPWVWGLWALTGGMLVAFGSALDHWRHHWKIRAVGLVGLSIWSTAFAIGTAVAAFSIATAGTTAPPTYLWAAFIIAVLVGYDDDERRDRAVHVP